MAFEYNQDLNVGGQGRAWVLLPNMLLLFLLDASVHNNFSRFTKIRTKMAQYKYFKTGTLSIFLTDNSRTGIFGGTESSTFI